MLELALRIFAVVVLVDAVVLLDKGGDPEFSLSSASVEAELYLGGDEDGMPVVSQKVHDPREGRDEYMVRRLNAMRGSAVNPSDAGTRKPWKNINEKLSDLSPSLEESDPANVPLRIVVNDDFEQSEDPAENSDAKSIHEQMEIAQRWFPILLRRAIGNMLNNNTKKELNELVEQLTFRTWKSEDFNGSEQKFVDWMLTVPFHARKRALEEDSDQRLLQKRSSCCSYCNQHQRTNCQPCIVNIFNNSNIGYVMLGPDGKLACGCGDCSSPQPLNFSIVLPKVDGSCGQPNAINVEYIPNCETPPVVTECTTTTTTECPTTESTTKAKCEDPLPYIQYESSTSFPYKYDFTDAPYQPPKTYDSPPCPCHKDKDSHPKPIYPWYNYPEPEYRPKNQNYGPSSFEDRYEPYNNVPFDIPSAEISDCSQEMDYSANYHGKRDSQYMDKKEWIYRPPQIQKVSKPLSSKIEDVRMILNMSPTFQSQEEVPPVVNFNLRNTLAKMGLAPSSERPVVAKALGSSRYNRERPFPPIRSQRASPKFEGFVKEPMKRHI